MLLGLKETGHAPAQLTLMADENPIDLIPKIFRHHVFCCFQQQLTTYIAMQTRLESEALVPFINPQGGGYFFALPGLKDAQDYYGRALLT